MGRDVQLGLMSLMRKGWRGSRVREAFCVQLLGTTSLGMVWEGNSFWGLVVGCASVAKKGVGGQTRGLWVQAGVLLRGAWCFAGAGSGGFFSPWSVVQVLVMLISSCW